MKKLKLFATISTMCLALAVLCFGVFSATQVTYTIGGSISYEVNDVFADVKTRVYASSFKDKSTLSTKVSTLAESGDVSDLTDTAYKYDFATTGDSQSFDNTEGGTKEGIKIEYNTTNKRTYFIVVSIKNRADNTISASISGKGLSSGANTVFIKSNAIASLTNKEEEKRLVMAFMLDNISTGTNGTIDFEYTISINNGELVQTYASLQYLNNDETYSINKVDKITTQVYTATITPDKSSGEKLDDEGTTGHLYNFKISNEELNLCSLAKIEFENVNFEQSERTIYVVNGNYKSLQEMFADQNFSSNILGRVANTEVQVANINLLKGEYSFSLAVVNINSFDIKITLEFLGDSAGSVNIINKASNFEASQFESKLYDNIITSTSYNFTLTSSKKCDALKMDLTSNSNTEKMVDITLTFDIKAGYYIFILTEEVMNGLLNQLNINKTLKELTDDDWNNLAMGAVWLDSYMAPKNNSLITPTRNDFEYPANKVKSTGSSYYIIIYYGSDDATSGISGSLQIDITNIQDYRDDVYTLSADGNYYEFTKLNNTELTEYEVASTYGDNNLPVKVIGNNAFRNTKITKVTLPDSITELGVNIFFGCAITSFEVPRQVTTLVKGTFSGAGFGTLTIPSTVKSIEMYAISDTATSTWSGLRSIENMIIKCDYSAFKGDITNADFDFSVYEIKNMTIYTNKLWDWLADNRLSGNGYITGSLYVKAEYLETMKTTYADSYLVTNDRIKAMA